MLIIRAKWSPFTKSDHILMARRDPEKIYLPINKEWNESKQNKWILGKQFWLYRAERKRACMRLKHKLSRVYCCIYLIFIWFDTCSACVLQVSSYTRLHIGPEFIYQAKVLESAFCGYQWPLPILVYSRLQCTLTKLETSIKYRPKLVKNYG